MEKFSAIQGGICSLDTLARWLLLQRVNGSVRSKIMTVAFTYWENRIAPVFDVARHILLIDCMAGRVIHKARRAFPLGSPHARRAYLEGLRIDALVCGAMSKPLQQVFEDSTIQVIPFVAGDLEEVIEAWMEGRLSQDAFAMPGCCGRNRRRHGRECGRAEPEGPSTDETCGVCLCSQCGLEIPHRRGVPCFQSACPQCGGAMVRKQTQEEEMESCQEETEPVPWDRDH